MVGAISSPIGDVDTVDIVGVRKDGGLDMVISVAAPIDGSPSTLLQLETKIRNYMKGAQSDAFLRQYGRSLGVSVTIYVSCAHPIAAAARALIEKMQAAATKEGIVIQLRTHMGDLH